MIAVLFEKLCRRMKVDRMIDIARGQRVSLYIRTPQTKVETFMKRKHILMNNNASR